MNQRWYQKLQRWVPPESVITPAEFDVAPLPADTPARRFIETHHYSGSYPPARFRFGLYWHGTLAGVAVFGSGTNEAARVTLLGGAKNDSVELVRFVLLDGVKGNGETWFLKRCFDQLKGEGLVGVAAYSDPVPRRFPEGRAFPGHVGVIYQAFNGQFLGKSRARWRRYFPDGSECSERALCKIKAGERGGKGAAARLCRQGAAALADWEEREAWLAEWLPQLTVRIWHTGNYRYVWPFPHRRLVAVNCYPKKGE